jgi:hypothetical protein
MKLPIYFCMLNNAFRIDLKSRFNSNHFEIIESLLKFYSSSSSSTTLEDKYKQLRERDTISSIVCCEITNLSLALFSFFLEQRK